MNLTNISKFIISFFIKHKCINEYKLSLKTKKVFKNLYDDIFNADLYLKNLKINSKMDLVKIKQIKNSQQITKPTTFEYNAFPSIINKYIDKNIKYEIEYNFNILNRKITIYFFIEENKTEININQFNKYVDNILIWFIILNKYSSKKCAQRIKLYLYFTDLKKKIPLKSDTILNENNANTAFTYSCPININSEIVIYRKEEWFKVLIHETFHNFGLDFSDINNEECNNEIRKLFAVKSEINIYEAYNEFWAKIINILFCSYINLNDKKDFNDFLLNSKNLLNFEINYNCFQMIKVLDYMNLSYKQLYNQNKYHSDLRNKYYKEKTNILSYYVITFILLNNYNSFIEWCSNNNLSLLQFNNSLNNQLLLCQFIKSKYKSNNLLDNINCVNKFYTKIKKQRNLLRDSYNYNLNPNKNINYKELNYILNNMRMSICEIN